MNSGIDKLVMVDWIREKFYEKDTKQDTINKCFTNIKKEIIKLCNSKGYELISKRGKGNKAYLNRKAI